MNTPHDMVAKTGDLYIIKQLRLHTYTFQRACDESNLEVIEYLVSMGADIHANNDYAVRQASEKGHINIVKYLVSEHSCRK